MSTDISTSGSSAPMLARADSAGRPLIVKVVAILGLVVALLVPLVLIHDLISDREARRLATIAEIGEAWGRQQRVFGPVLIVPYLEPVADGGTERARTVERAAYVLPNRYVVAAQVVPERRRRGIFEAAVYRADLDITGAFVLPDPESWAPNGATILWEAARVLVDVRDKRSLSADIALSWSGGQSLPFTPSLHDSGLAARVPGLSASAVGQRLEFALALSLKGSDLLSFLPLGRETQIVVRSPWPDPSFVGSHLPDVREVLENGFVASWTISYFARDYPQVWTGGTRPTLHSAVDRSEFGVRFVSVASAYQQADRATKYGALVIVATFTLFFLFEIVQGLRIHVFQYGLVGLALCVFYLLLVSLAEQIGFGPAYAIASAAVIGQVLAYSHGALGGWRGTASLGALLAAMYVGLYKLMRLEDLALLIGSIGLFAALSVIMLVTRRVDWHALAPLGGGPSAAPRRGATAAESR